MPAPTVPSRVSGPRLAATVFLPFALGYALSFLYRTVNAVIAGQLTQELGIGAAGLGVLTSVYFISFAAFQVPLGILLDRYGPGRVEAALLMVAALGALVFALGGGLTTLMAGRALIGLGVSACLMAAFTANVLWWPRERLPLINGLTMACGGLGAVLATTPVAALLPVTGWRGLFVGLAAVTLATAILIVLVVPERRDDAGKSPATLAALVAGTLQVFSNRLFWRMAPACMLVQGTFLAYLGLWMGVWLRDVTGLDHPGVAEVLQYAAMALAVGYAGNGAIAGFLERLGVPSATTALAGMTAGLGLLSLLAFGIADWPWLWAIYPFFATASSLIYALLSRRFAPELAGRVNTAVNMLTFASAFVIQAGIGTVIELFPATVGGHDPTGHRVALLGLLGLQTTAVLWLAWPQRDAATAPERAVPVTPADPPAPSPSASGPPRRVRPRHRRRRGESRSPRPRRRPSGPR